MNEVHESSSIDTSLLNAITTSTSLGDPSEEEFCLVCNDISTGYHYGTPSCNGCKTFFRRTVMKKQTFVCQYGEKCLINKSVRCACRHCRFQKCLAVGMNKDAIQQNRDPIGYTKRTRRYPPVKAISTKKESVETDVSQVTSTTVSIPSSARSEHLPTNVERTGENQILQNLANIEHRVQILRNSQIFVQKSFPETMLQPSILFDQELVKKQEEFSYNFTELRRAKQADHQYWHERDWILMIEWAKTIPIFNTLSFSDKLALLRHSALSYPSINQCFYTKFIDLNTIVFPDGSFFDRTQDPDRSPSLQRKKIKMLNNLLKPIHGLEMDINEIAAAKTIFFLNPDIDELSNEARSKISEARCVITNALYQHMIRKSSNSVDRFAKLLLLSAAISTIVVEIKETNFFEQIQFSQLAKQLFLNMKEDELESNSQSFLNNACKNSVASCNSINVIAEKTPFQVTLPITSYTSTSYLPYKTTANTSTSPNFVSAFNSFLPNSISNSDNITLNISPSITCENVQQTFPVTTLVSPLLNSTSFMNTDMLNSTSNSCFAPNVAATFLSAAVSQTNIITQTDK